MTEPHRCEICGARVRELRRRRCTLCYSRWAESRPVGFGARCICCGERRRDVLKSAELLGAFQPVCFNCAGRVERLRTVPATYAQLRARLERDRRKADRRIGKPDTRIFKLDRRKNERRLDGDRGDLDLDLIDDTMILEIQELADERARSEPADMTRIRDVGLIL